MSLDDYHRRLGIVAAMMAKKDQYCGYPIACLTLWIEPAILLDQIHFFHDLGGNPVGYMTWACIADDTERRLINDPEVVFHLSEWNEGDRLENGLPRLGEWSSQMFVPFEARQLRRARVLWINRRWFLERQIDVSRANVRDRLANWLLDEFAYAVTGNAGAGDAFTSRVRTLYADRYGISSGQSGHGGSGRVATIGCFQAKGIGAAPLVGAGANWVHSSGCCSVEEGIREAICGEVAATEFPHGAVPVIAILDTGLYVCPPVDAKRPENTHSVRRAIIIHLAVLRVAHAERARFSCSP
jgi:hemolysin-activating ACP:hemolysin acyltransferase